MGGSFFAKTMIAATVLAAISPTVNGNVFLGRTDQNAVVEAMSYATKHELLTELEKSLGSEHRRYTEKRVAKIEELMRPSYHAVPKNENGLLGQSAATFLLHRLFVLRHGWSVRGLDPEDKSLGGFNTSSASAIFEGKVSSHVQDAFEKRLGGRGATLQEVAVLAATLEHLVHSEAMTRLNAVYQSQSFNVEDVLSNKEAEDVFDSYMSVFILGFLLPGNATNITSRQVNKLRSQIAKVYPNWPEVQKFTHDVQNIFAGGDYWDFPRVASVVEEIGDRYGNWQDKECQALKDQLIAIEDKGEAGAGRVRLADFYRKAVEEDNFQFGESLDYLRQLGAVDESVPDSPKVLIANYVNSPSNCVASSKYYSVCCRNECEDILSHLEAKIARPAALPKDIAALVASLPSRSTPANRTLPQWLLARLDEVAAYHQGQVPIHSRLFMQWMHFAYPRECPFPHLSGATYTTRVEDVVKQDVSIFVASKDEMISHVSAPVSNTTADADAMWTADEELIIWHKDEPPEHSATFRALLFIGSVISGSVMLVHNIESSWYYPPKAFASSSGKHFV